MTKVWESRIGRPHTLGYLYAWIPPGLMVDDRDNSTIQVAWPVAYQSSLALEIMKKPLRTIKEHQQIIETIKIHVKNTKDPSKHLQDSIG